MLAKLCVYLLVINKTRRVIMCENSRLLLCGRDLRRGAGFRFIMDADTRTKLFIYIRNINYSVTLKYFQVFFKSSCKTHLTFSSLLISFNPKILNSQFPDCLLRIYFHLSHVSSFGSPLYILNVLLRPSLSHFSHYLIFKMRKPHAPHYAA